VLGRIEGTGATSETRKIAAMATDVVGFSRLTSADEDRTLARLRTIRLELIDPTVASQNGRVFKRTGDGALVEFWSVVKAVHCAITVQNAMIVKPTDPSPSLTTTLSPIK
jgi:adenylate cyclase